MLGNLFKRQSHYVFNYKPRYYDERKERIEKLKKQYGKTDDIENVISPETPNIITKNNLRAQWNSNKRQVANKKSNIRLAIIIAILVGITAYVFQIHTLF